MKENNKTIKVLQGKKAGSGIAIGPLFIVERSKAVARKDVPDAQGELDRLSDAVKTVSERLETAAAGLDAKNAGILDAQRMLLNDEEFLSKIRNLLRKEHINAEYAAFKVGESFAARFEGMENAYLRARAADMRDIARKLSDTLSGVNKSARPDVPSIIVSEEISPEEITSLDHDLIIGIVTKRGSETSHASIIARNLGLPYVFGIEYSEDELKGTVIAAVDAGKGQLILSPDEKTLENLSKLKRELENLNDCVYKGRMKLCANISGPEDVSAAMKFGAEGIGLYRTEFLFMNRRTLPDEDEQFEAYKRVLKDMDGREVIIRTMDIGADKPVACLDLPKENNPALGKRGVRLCLEEPEIFRTQLRALLRAARYGNEKIMCPMIASAWEIDEIRQQIEIASGELRSRGIDHVIPPLGIMIETPAAALMSDELAGKVDFFSIGTNDLTQYTLALDRMAEGLDRYYKADHEAVLRLIGMTVENAHKAGIEVGICGELGGREDLIERFVNMGIDELSMAPSCIPEARKALELAEKKNVPDDSEEDFGSPADGKLIPMEDIPDESFASGMLGRCIGVEPDNGNIYAPCDGEITMIAETRHAVAMSSDRGNELLIHVGIDTVKLGGRGFDCLVQVGERVKKGQRIMNADLQIIRDAGLSTITVLALTANK